MSGGELKLRVKLRAGTDLLDLTFSPHVCPITGSVLVEPVIAADGRTYSKQALLDWFASCRERQLPIVSPVTREEMSERLEPDLVNEEEAHRAEEPEQSASQRAADADRSASQPDSAPKPHAPAKFVADLGSIFALFDDLRGLLAASLDGWQPPQIVVVGQESSGKSSILERLMMTPLLPRDENLCTRLPIHVRLRRSDKALPPKLEVFNVEKQTTERGPYVIAAQTGATDVSEEIRRILTEEQGSLRGVSSNRVIVLHITRPDVPFVDLVDMPGIVCAPSGNEPADMAKQTSAIIKAHVESEQGRNSLYLAVVKATSAPNTSQAMRILQEANMYPKTLGVFTFCDELGIKNARRLKQWLREPLQGFGAVALDPYGWVAVSNAPPEDEAGNAIVYPSSFERIQSQAFAEIGMFTDMGLGELLEQGHASNNALVARLNSMFVDHLKGRWMPLTLRRLAVERHRLELEHALLGMPPAHQPAPAFRDTLRKAAGKSWEKSVKALVHEYVSSLSSLKPDVEAIVAQEMKASITESWLQPLPDSVVLSTDQHRQLCTWLAEDSKYCRGVTGGVIRLNLLYRASRDGWQASNFHAMCDDKGATVTVIKCTEGYIFGGYAGVPWSRSRNTNIQHQESAATFLFSMHSPSRIGPVKLSLLNPCDPNACVYDNSTGPTFGRSKHMSDGSYVNDIHVADCANNNWWTLNQRRCSGREPLHSHTVISSFQLPPGQSADTFFTGSRNFEAAEVEVFRVQFSDINCLVPFESFNQIFMQIPDISTPVLERCKLVLKDGAAFWVRGVQKLLASDGKEQPEWPSPEAEDILQTPPFHITERFPKLVEDLIAEIQQKILPNNNTSILDAVTKSLQILNDEVGSLERWERLMASDGIEVTIFSADRVSILAQDILLIFLRYSTEMLEEARAHMHELVGRANLVERCASQRLDIIRRQHATERAVDSLFLMLNVHTPQGRLDWETRSYFDLFSEWFGVDRVLKETGKGFIKWMPLDSTGHHGQKGAIVTVIKTTRDFIFGGYDDVLWWSRLREVNFYGESGDDVLRSLFGFKRGASVGSPHAFLFALICPGQPGPVQLPLIKPKPEQVVGGPSGRGPALRLLHEIVPYFVRNDTNPVTRRPEIRISKDSSDSGMHRVSKTSDSNVQWYQLPSGEHQPDTFFTGTKNFEVQKMQTFRVTHSYLLSEVLYDQICEWLGGQVWLQLLYRASRDGMHVEDFHSRCERKGATVVVIKSTDGFLFGGYNDKLWEKCGINPGYYSNDARARAYQESKEAFIFALYSPSALGRFKMSLQENQYPTAIGRNLYELRYGSRPQSVADYSERGPTFGLHDIVVRSKQGKLTCETCISSYQLPAGTSADTLLTGKRHNEVAEMEVFAVLPQ